NSLTSPYGGCYAIFKGQYVANLSLNTLKSTLLAGMWVWCDKKNGLVFDSVEMTELKFNRDLTTVKPMVIALVQKTANVLIEEHNVPHVYCGQRSGISCEVGAVQGSIVPLYLASFKEDYYGYSDAREQFVLSAKDRPYYFFDCKNNVEEIRQWLMPILNSKCELENLIPLW